MSKEQKQQGVMTARLKLPDRLRLLGILPPTGGLATIRLVRDLRERFSLGKEELEKLEVKTEGDSIRWNAEKDKGREFTLGGFEIELIVSSLRKLDKEERLTPDLVSLWDQFVDGKVDDAGQEQTKT